MTRCDEVRLDFHSYLMGELAPPAAQEVRRHVDECDSCRAELARVSSVHKLLVEAPLEHSPGPALEDEVFALVELDRVGHLASEVPLGAEPPDDLERAALERAGVISPRRSRATTVLVPALGVATVVLGVLGINWRSEADRIRDDAGPLGQTMQQVRLEGASAPSDATTVELVRYGGTGGTGYRVEMDSPFPPAPEGYYYELWMVGASGRVSCGAFKGGSFHDFPVGVDPSEYPYLQITLEPEDGDESMNGTVQWEGRLDSTASLP
ncbi:MAG TPA: anti-sigma factor [Actinomycetota bacterium]|nr:anti-sigma factor [Actinomycetota bacterium]